MVFWYLTIYLIFTVFALILCLQLAGILKYYDTQINIIIITHKFGYILKNVSAVLASAFSYVSGWRFWSERYFVSFHKSMHNSRNLRAAFWNKNWLEYVTDCRTMTMCIQLLRERLSEKVHAIIPKGIVGRFEFTFLQRNLKEWYKRSWTYVCEC